MMTASSIESSGRCRKPPTMRAFAAPSSICRGTWLDGCKNLPDWIGAGLIMAGIDGHRLLRCRVER
jgi:hypothetical protein